MDVELQAGLALAAKRRCERARIALTRVQSELGGEPRVQNYFAARQVVLTTFLPGKDPRPMSQQFSRSRHGWASQQWHPRGNCPEHSSPWPFSSTYPPPAVGGGCHNGRPRPVSLPVGSLESLCVCRKPLQRIGLQHSVCRWHANCNNWAEKRWRLPALKCLPVNPVAFAAGSPKHTAG